MIDFSFRRELVVPLTLLPALDCRGLLVVDELSVCGPGPRPVLWGSILVGGPREQAVDAQILGALGEGVEDGHGSLLIGAAEVTLSPER
jgi:hypothetical protein